MNEGFLRRVYSEVFPDDVERAIATIIKEAGADGNEHALRYGDPDSYRFSYGGSLTVNFNLDSRLEAACDSGMLPFTYVELKSGNYPLVEYYYGNTCVIHFKKASGIGACPINSKIRSHRTQQSTQTYLNFGDDIRTPMSNSNKLFALVTYGLRDFFATFVTIGFPVTQDHCGWAYNKDISPLLMGDFGGLGGYIGMPPTPTPSPVTPQPLVKKPKREVSNN